MTPSDITPRDCLLSHFAWLVGGWNASPGVHSGHLRAWEQEFKGDDDKLARHVLATYRSGVVYPLEREIAALKARLYDLEHKA